MKSFHKYASTFTRHRWSANQEKRHCIFSMWCTHASSKFVLVHEILWISCQESHENNSLENQFVQNFQWMLFEQNSDV